MFTATGISQNNPPNPNNAQLINSNNLIQKKKKDSREQLAMEYYRKQDYKKAAELFDQLHNEKGSNYYYSYYYMCLIKLQEYKKAEKIAKQQKRRYAGNYRAAIDEAYAIDLGGNNKKALKILNNIIDNLPGDKNKIIIVSSALQSKGYTDLAVEVLKKAQLSATNNYSYAMEIANAYFYSGNYQDMFTSYLDHLLNVPTDMQRVKSRLQYVMRMDVNSNLSDMLKKELLTYAQQYPENKTMAEMLMWYSLQTRDFTMGYRQAVAMDRRFGNSDLIILELAKIAMANYNYSVSSEAYNYLADKGNNTPYYQEAVTGSYVSAVKLMDENPEATIKDYKKIQEDGIEIINNIGVNQITSDVVLNAAHISAVKLNQSHEAMAMLNTALEQMQGYTASGKSPTANKQEALLKLELADILLITGKLWDASLLYSQVESSMKNEPVGHEAKLRNAKIFYYSGEFDWANTRLDVLKSSTSKLISNDAIELSMFIKNMQEEDTLGLNLRAFAGADLYAYQGKYDSALRLLDQIEKNPSGYYSMEFALYKKGDIYNLIHDYEAADSIYNSLIISYPGSIKADNALFKQAELQRIHFNNNDKAKELYLILMNDYPDSIYAGKARKKYREITD